MFAIGRLNDGPPPDDIAFIGLPRGCSTPIHGKPGFRIPTFGPLDGVFEEPLFTVTGPAVAVPTSAYEASYTFTRTDCTPVAAGCHESGTVAWAEGAMFTPSIIVSSPSM